MHFLPFVFYVCTHMCILSHVHRFILTILININYTFVLSVQVGKEFSDLHRDHDRTMTENESDHLPLPETALHAFFSRADLTKTKVQPRQRYSEQEMRTKKRLSQTQPLTG